MESADAVHDAARSSTLRRLAAVGLAGYGVVPLLVAGLVPARPARQRARHPVS